MPIRKNPYLVIIIAGGFILASLLLFLPNRSADAQCGSQASSCKNCHEVQGMDSVNNDGTGWHTGHAFGDFCYLCHAGNNQSMDQNEAHAGMVPPLSDVEAGCQSCHPNDLMERAQIYATALGVEIGSGGGASPAATTGEGTGSEPVEDTTTTAPSLVVSSEEIIDYNQKYAEEVIGVRTINWGNIILAVMTAAVALGGGLYVFYNERRLRGLSLFPEKTQPATGSKIHETIQLDEYSQDILDLVPQIAKLNPPGLQALKRILENPDQASEMLHSLSRLDPELVKRIRNMDRESRALLLALSGD